MEEEAANQLQTRSAQTVRNRLFAQISTLEEKEQAEAEVLQNARNRFNREYPSVGFNGMEKDNTCYERLLQDYQSDYEPKYEQEFENSVSRFTKVCVRM